MFFRYDKSHSKLIQELKKNPNLAFTLKEVFEDENLGLAVAESLGINGLKEKTDLNRLSLLEKLNASGRNIRSLEGIEFLNGLIDLDVSQNQITKLPDYSLVSQPLFENRDKLVYLNLADNPVSDVNQIFSLDASENRRRFINQFENASSRFDLGDANEKIFSANEKSPELIRFVLKESLPGTLKTALNPSQLEDVLDSLLLKYAALQIAFNEKEIWKDAIVIQNGRPTIRQDAKVKAYQSAQGMKDLAARYEKLLNQDEQELIQALAGEASVEDALMMINEDYLNAIHTLSRNPEKLTKRYTKVNGKWEAVQKFERISSSQADDQEKALLSKLSDTAMRNDYQHYLDTRAVLQTYLSDHPERAKAVGKLIQKNDDFSIGFLERYLALENNQMLSDEQRQTLSQARDSFKKFVEGFSQDVRSFFDQDIFDLEVEMKYVDMLEKGRSGDFN